MKQIDRIRNMNAEELAEYIVEALCVKDCTYCPAKWQCSKSYEDVTCEFVVKAWLESEVKDDIFG